MLGRPLKYGLGHAAFRGGLAGQAAEREARAGFSTARSVFGGKPPRVATIGLATDHAQGCATLANGCMRVSTALRAVKNARLSGLCMLNLEPVTTARKGLGLENGLVNVLVAGHLTEPAAESRFGQETRVFGGATTGAEGNQICNAIHVNELPPCVNDGQHAGSAYQPNI